jgi:L-ribulokinase
MSKRYAIGVDYGTESGRAVLVDLSDGTEVADHVTPYPHNVIDEKLPISGIKLAYDWALQHPQDYIDVLTQSVPAVVQASGVNPVDIIGLGIDFTACTMLPIDKEGQPLCFNPLLTSNPHSWVKLWKHHAAQDEANLIKEISESRGESDIVRNSCTTGYKSIWHKKDGYPSKDFFKALDPRLENLTETKLRGDVVPLGTKAGELTEAMAKMMGLKAGTAIAVGNVDAHAAVPGVGVVTPGKLVMAMGTSICHMLLGTEEREVEGMCGVVEDGIIPGYLGYEAGQSAVGDIFAWYVEQGVPAYVQAAADQEGINVHEWLERHASAYKPGETGLLALDWWNGNRSVLVDTELNGLILGYSLLTKPEEIYRTLLEATAFGTRKIVDAFHNNGVEVQELYACGGLPQKNRLLMQIYADVTNREIKIADSKQTPALGAAMFGAVAAGAANGGYDNIVDAAHKMARVRKETFKPIAENVAVYEQLYQEYSKLHDYFGRGENDVMKRLRSIREEARH